MHLRAISPLLLAALGLSVVPACTKKSDKPAPAPALPAHPEDMSPVDSQRSTAGLLDVKAELRSDGLMLHIGQLPANATLECDMDQKPLVPCHDGALFARPDEGDHKIHATALLNGAIVALGESAAFTVLPGTGGPLDSEAKPRNALTVVSADSTFVNGGTEPLSKDLTLKFKLAETASCTVAMKCKYDSRTSPFWVDCDQGGQSFTLDKALLASGLQYFSVQASCGEELGPILTMFFYGVPDDYKPLMLKDTADSNGRHQIDLIKGDDCPIDQQKFECADKGSADFAACPTANTLDQPAAGYQVRLSCADQKGPVLSL